MNNSSQRQEIRQQQRGALRRSTIVALVVVAALAGIGSQIPRLLPLLPETQQKLIAWSAEQGFTVQRADVIGRKQITSTNILQALNIQRGMPIFAYDLNTARQKLVDNPWIKSVMIERHLPQTIFVKIQERTPAARWQLDGKLALVDNEGVVLTTDNLDHYQHLPIIIGQDGRHKLLELFALLKGEPTVAQQVSAATWISGRRWDLTLKNGVVIKLPAEQPQLALSKLASYDRAHQMFERDIKAVDLRLPDKAVVQPTTRANVMIERPDFSDTPDKSRKNI